MNTNDDSWVPTTSTPNVITCKSGVAGTPPTAAQCSPLTTLSPCLGCLDMTAMYVRGEANFNS